jgi:DNA-binding NtrC family response regulator
MQPPPGHAEPNSETQVLVVDDEVEIRKMLERALDPLGFRVYTVNSALHAIEMLWELPELACIVADLRMAGPQGIDLLDYAARERPGVGRVLFSGYLTTDLIAGSARHHSLVAKTAPLHTLVVAIDHEIKLRSRVTATRTA